MWNGPADRLPCARRERYRERTNRFCSVTPSRLRDRHLAVVGWIDSAVARTTARADGTLHHGSAAAGRSSADDVVPAHPVAMEALGVRVGDRSNRSAFARGRTGT